MIDRDITINNLEMNIRWIEDIPAHQFPGWRNVTMAMRDAMELLKEQEVKPVIADKRYINWDDSYDEATYFEDTFYHCPSCNRILSRTHMKKSIHFCEECGQEVKWE